MTETVQQVTLKGNPVTLIGDTLKIGEVIPDVTLLRTDLSSVNLSEFKGKATIILAVQSIDTGVCSLEAKAFNERVGELKDDLNVLLVSADLPFAQARWQKENNIQNITLLSDHRDTAFGTAFGALIKELRLLARIVYVLDSRQVLQSVQVVPEIAEEPDYDAAIDEAKRLIDA